MTSGQLLLEVRRDEGSKSREDHNPPLLICSFQPRADGSEFPIDAHVGMFERGGRRWTLAVIRDATEQQRILTEVRAAHRAAEEVARAKGEFLGFAAHDLIQPVQTIEMMLQTVERYARQCAGLAEISALGTVSLARIRELLKMLLEISRIESGALKVAEEAVPVAEIFEYLERQFGPAARAKALTFVLEPSAHVIETDPSLLRCMLSNLVSNAIRYTAQGEVRVMSEVEADGKLCLAVRDTGIGIPESELVRVFDDFHRLPEAERTVREGYGLGLGIVRRLSATLGCPVDVRSALGRGSTFRIEIPAGKVYGIA